MNLINTTTVSDVHMYKKWSLLSHTMVEREISITQAHAIHLGCLA